MANVLKMAQIQAILQLHSAGLSRRAIARRSQVLKRLAPWLHARFGDDLQKRRPEIRQRPVWSFLNDEFAAVG